MRYHVLATDYDGTLAHHGRVDEPTLAALKRLRESGRKLILVTGRELDDLLKVFPEVELFDLLVAENGALLYRPETRQETILAERPPSNFGETLRSRGVDPLSTGRVIVATWEPNETVVFETIRDLGLELQVIFNKGAVMVLPSGVNKATGLESALQELELSPHNAVAVGDAENDHAFLSLCECSVAVANALAITKEYADWVTQADHGAGVAELIGKLLGDDLREVEPRLDRHHILLGHRDDGGELKIPPYGASLMIAGTSGAGKSTLAAGFFERLAERGYQFCIIDPEGDYLTLRDAVVLGDEQHPPALDEMSALLARPAQNVVINLLGIALKHRPEFFDEIFARLQELRARTGRPHWIVIDEAHHMLPASRSGGALAGSQKGILLITVHPDHLAHDVAASADLVIAVGQSPQKTFKAWAHAAGETPGRVPDAPLKPGEAIAWIRNRHGLARFTVVPPRAELRRHRRKYMEGELGPDVSFYFRGPQGKLNLRAQNLMAFLQIAEGVDDETWEYHLKRKDYSRWLESTLKDADLAREVEAIEEEDALSPAQSRAMMKERIEARYSSPA